MWVDTGINEDIPTRFCSPFSFPNNNNNINSVYTNLPKINQYDVVFIQEWPLYIIKLGNIHHITGHYLQYNPQSGRIRHILVFSSTLTIEDLKIRIKEVLSMSTISGDDIKNLYEKQQAIKTILNTPSYEQQKIQKIKSELERLKLSVL